MNITRFTDYSLRVLIFAALHHDKLVTIGQIADQYGISKNHLMKVVHTLSAQGYLASSRGKNGGIRLQRTAEQINLGKVVRLNEQNSVLVECFGDNNQCVITPSCQLKKTLADAMECFFIHLDQFTLADLIGNSQGNELKQLLNIESSDA